MEKNLVEHSDSFTRKGEEDTNTNDTPHSSFSEPTDNVVDVTKHDDETKKDADHSSVLDGIQEEPQVEKKEENEEKEEEVIVEVPPESPPPNLEKVSEDIDGFIDNYNSDSKEDQEIPDYVEKFMDLLEEKIARYDTGETKWGDVAEEDYTLMEAVNRVSKLMKMLSNTDSLHAVKLEQVKEKEKEKEEEEEEKEKVEEEEGKKDNEKEKRKEDIKGKTMNRIGAIQQRGMSYLEEEFRLLMEEYRNHNKTEPNVNKGKHVAVAEPSDAETIETVIDFPGFSEETVTNLNKIAREMISGGYESECRHVYAVSRKHAFEDSLRKLGYEKISIDEVQKMQWESLEREQIPTWLNTFKECTTVWFPSERKLAETVFSGNPLIVDFLCGNLTRIVAIQLLNFAESLSMTKRAAEKLFKLLDVYEALRDVIPNLEKLFPEELVGEIKAETTLAKNWLGEAAVLIFCELENSIKSDAGKTPVAGGAVHPLTRWFVNYVRLAGEYKDTLEEVFREHSKMERADSTSRSGSYNEEDQNQNQSRNQNQNQNQKEKPSAFAAQLMRMMELLDSNLEGKAKLYKEVALSCIFMMNNGRYIVQKIKGSTEIYAVMGETWCRKRSTELRSYHKNYQIETWSKILSCLSPKGVTDSNGKVQKPVLKERFKSFNALFEEIHKTQSTWVVYDEQLQSELRVSISALVIPAYRSFLGRFSQYLDPGRQTEKYIKFQAEDIENYIDDLFDGNPHYQAMARKKA